MAYREKVAYFSMEIALDAAIPTYAGGLGILAGDTIRAAADMAVPMVAVSLVHRKGYFFQHLDSSGWQTEQSISWVPDDYLTPLEPRVEVTVDGRRLALRAWRYDVQGASGRPVSVILLDTDLPENPEWDRRLTDHLYGGDYYYRLCQEVVLGMGGVLMLQALGYTGIRRFHMNEGHASLLTIQLLEDEKHADGRDRLTEQDIENVRNRCVFTTHTPVPAGHDKFPLDLVKRVVGLTDDYHEHERLLCCGDEVNLTYLALNMSRYVNGVARQHKQVAQKMFAGYEIDSITNGVHAATWASEPFQQLFDWHISDWRQDAHSLRSIMSVPVEDIWGAHQAAKNDLIEYINHETNAGFDHDFLTFGSARRSAPYKRMSLPLTDPDRLKWMASEIGPLQFVFAGKAHPGDEAGKGIIQHIFRARDAMKVSVRVVYLPNYDMQLAKRLISGVDVWLNTPIPPLEASGTSGMKAALNGVPSLSILDGWWCEGCVEGVTGWAIDGEQSDETDRWSADAKSFYEKLANVVVPMYYRDRKSFVAIMRHAIALNGSFFNTHRMLQQYVAKAYFPG